MADEIILEMTNGVPADNRLDGISDKNYVVASGVIVNRYDAKNATLLTIMVRGGRKLDKRNYPQFVLTREVKDAAAELNTGDHVKITGVISSQRNPQTGEFKNVIRATSLERTKTKLAELTTERNLGKVRDVPTADFYVAGTIVKFEAFGKGVVRLVIKSKLENGHTVYGNYHYFAQELAGVIDELKVGNRICAIGEVQTDKKETEGEKPKYFQTNVITDISSIENVLSIKK